MPRDDMMLRQRAEIDHLRSVVRQCARVLQWHLGMYIEFSESDAADLAGHPVVDANMRKDEKMMLGALHMAWDAVGRGFCEAPSDLPEASNASDHRAPEGRSGASACCG